MKITQEEFDEWRRSPVSVAFFNWLAGVKEGAEADWLDALFKDEGGYLIGQKRLELKARIQVAKVIGSVTFEDIKDESIGD